MLANQETIVDRYRALMEEIKWRTQVIRSAHTLPFPRAGAAVELSYLQLRMVCEVIALGCLLVHGDVVGLRTIRLKKMYQADAIIHALEDLHADFYPIPCKIKYDTYNQAWRVDDPIAVNPQDILDKPSLITLYHECSLFLHRGNLNFVLPATVRRVKFETIQNWVNKITNLLHNHRLKLADGDRELWIDMHGPERFAAAYLMRNTGRTTLAF
jgi:hypothetical protein